MPRLVPRLLRAIAAVTVVCGSLSACAVPSGQPYGSSYYSAQVYSTPVYRGGYYGPGSGTGYGGYYAAPANRGYYGPGSGTGYGRYYPGRGYYGPGSGTGLGRFW